MNYPIIFKLLSVITTTIALAFAASYGVGEWLNKPGQFQGEPREGWLWSIAVAIALTVVFHLLGRKANNKIFRKEALAVIGLGWITASIIGAIPYYLILENASVADAIFESASGFTTTGASVFSDLESFPRGLLFWRCLSQWIGGMGVVVFFVAILSFLGAGAKILYSNEATANSTEIDSGRIQSGVLQIFYLYLGLTGACIVSLMVCGMGGYDAVCHAFTTISTGGFSTRTDSVAAFESPAIEWVLICFMALGGTSFLVMIRIFIKGNFRQIQRSTEVFSYYALLAVSIILTAIALGLADFSGELHHTVRASAFQVVSIMTTTGYATEDYMLWPPVTHVMLMALMVCGGCSGSTAGGAKILRIVVAAKVVLRNVERAYRSRVIRPVQINGKVLDRDDQETIMNFLVLLAMVTIAGTIGTALLDRVVSFDTVLSAVFACLFNIGPGFDQVGPTENFGFFHDSSKYLLSLLMIMGRLELYAVLVLFSPSLWKRFS